MTKREARRLAMITIWNEIEGSLEASDEWARHPETDEPFTREERSKVEAAGRAWMDAFTLKIPAEVKRPSSG